MNKWRRFSKGLLIYSSYETGLKLHFSSDVRFEKREEGREEFRRNKIEEEGTKESRKIATKFFFRSKKRPLLKKKMKSRKTFFAFLLLFDSTNEFAKYLRGPHSLFTPKSLESFSGYETEVPLAQLALSSFSSLKTFYFPHFGRIRFFYYLYFQVQWPNPTIRTIVNQIFINFFIQHVRYMFYWYIFVFFNVIEISTSFHGEMASMIFC